jgi:hypothetical protein
MDGTSWDQEELGWLEGGSCSERATIKTRGFDLVQIDSNSNGFEFKHLPDKSIATL